MANSLRVPAEARPMADSAAVLYVLGGALVMVSIPFGGPLPGRAPLTAVAVTAIVTGVLLHRYGYRLPLLGFQLLTAFATALIAIAVQVGGPTAAAYPFFYVWVAAWAFYWLSPGAAWTLMAWMALVASVRVILRVPLEPQTAVAIDFVYWLTLVVTACSTGVLLSYLVGHLARGQEQLGWRRQQLADVMAGLPLSVFALDAEGVVVLFEGRALDRLQFVPETALHRSLFELLPEGHPLAAAARQALAGAEASGSLRVGEAEFEYRMSPHGLEGSLTRVSGTLVDVTESRRHEREVVERRTREALLGRVSHELRTPLNAMLGFLQLLGMSESGWFNDKQSRYLEQVEMAARMQLDLVNDLLDLQKLRSGLPSYQLETVPLPRLLEEAADIARSLALDGSVQIVVEPALVTIDTDRRRVTQAVLNLLSNAVKFSPPGEEVRLRARATPSGVVIDVTDHGPGLAEKDQERVFEEFYQAPTKVSHKGTGLGLAISRQIIRGLGGELSVASQLGEGATFRIWLPQPPVVAAGELLNAAG